MRLSCCSSSAVLNGAAAGQKTSSAFLIAYDFARSNALTRGHPRGNMCKFNYSSITQFQQHVDLKDYRFPTRYEYVRNLRKLAQMLVDEHDGAVPSSIEALERLPGVGHKTASVVMSQAFGEPAFAVDTHIHRLAARWGLSSGKTVEQTERDLKKVFPREEWSRRHLQMIYFGREHCPARNHDQTKCPICAWAAKSKRPLPRSR